MNTYTEDELKQILDRHNKWWRGEEEGECADLSGANLRSADLRRANLRSADLSGADLSGADLRDADLYGANLYGANLYGADLRDADLSGADLRDANLSGADLSGANLRSADLSGANLRSADLSGANLRSADLYGADLSGANLRSADLRRANLRSADLRDADLPPLLIVPEEGSFIGWKKAYRARWDSGSGVVILKLEIPAEAMRVNSTGRKCRASKAKVLAVYEPGTKTELPADTVVVSGRDKRFEYRVGQVAEVPDANPDFREECTRGIHFFITRAEAEAY